MPSDMHQADRNKGLENTRKLRVEFSGPNSFNRRNTTAADRIFQRDQLRMSEVMPIARAYQLTQQELQHAHERIATIESEKIQEQNKLQEQVLKLENELELERERQELQVKQAIDKHGDIIEHLRQENTEQLRSIEELTKELEKCTRERRQLETGLKRANAKIDALQNELVTAVTDNKKKNVVIGIQEHSITRNRRENAKMTMSIAKYEEYVQKMGAEARQMRGEIERQQDMGEKRMKWTREMQWHYKERGSEVAHLLEVKKRQEQELLELYQREELRNNVIQELRRQNQLLRNHLESAKDSILQNPCERTRVSHLLSQVLNQIDSIQTSLGPAMMDVPSSHHHRHHHHHHHHLHNPVRNSETRVLHKDLLKTEAKRLIDQVSTITIKPIPT